MDQESRRAAVIALVRLAASDDYLDRIDAGRALATFTDLPESRATLLRLLLDRHDTAVTLETAEAMLRRLDLAAFSVVAEALTSADFEQLTYIHEAVRRVFTPFASERDEAIGLCDALLLDGNTAVGPGAVQLRELLAEISPLLFPRPPV
ncbi:hypothetical protein HPO96_21005 [Kribbella sandramycini]|uniref:HEAT repeat domain-containing protein n=1 Tax=Kribbella sandramycini TaxID=60450 RepID=A0A7Y4L1S6_9ACTN|nr:hypothetical protein [Kribbella sandramycini]MBB6566617.1 hypothetical protein [Kribbella sandramycini]NOL42728.1 hypothetical protein [Kribbella sandramycini]